MNDEEREEIAALHCFLHSGDRLVAPDLHALEIALEQRVISRGNGFDQLLVIVIVAVLRVGGDVDFVILARLGARLVNVRTLREQVHDPAELRPVADGYLDRNHLRCQALFDLLVDRVEVRVLLVHHRDDEQHRVGAGHRFVEHLLRTDFDAGRRAHDDERAVGRSESGDRVTLEVEVPGCVNEVDLRVHPLRERAAEIDREPAVDLFRRVIGERGAILHRAVALAGAGNECERVDQCGLPARSVTDHGHVPDVCAAILPHCSYPRLLG